MTQPSDPQASCTIDREPNFGQGSPSSVLCSNPCLFEHLFISDIVTFRMQSGVTKLLVRSQS